MSAAAVVAGATTSGAAVTALADQDADAELLALWDEYARAKQAYLDTDCQAGGLLERTYGPRDRIRALAPAGLTGLAIHARLFTEDAASGLDNESLAIAYQLTLATERLAGLEPDPLVVAATRYCVARHLIA